MNVLLLFGLFPFISYAVHDESKDLRTDYFVVSDVKDASIPKGSFVLQGEVKMFSSAFPLSGVAVGPSEKNRVLTDSAGRFEIQLSLKAVREIYIFKADWAEIVINNYELKSQHRITITAYMHQVAQGDGNVKRKPVIYMYADQSLNASVQINPLGSFTFTYPEYRNGWNVTVDSAGMLTDVKTNQTYPYLFWEAESEDLFYQTNKNTIPGFVIQTDTSIQFLENVLAQLGLNSTEQTDFITFWGPILEQKKYALVQFLVDDGYNKSIANLTISPQPDWTRRVYILCSPIDDSTTGMEVVPQDFSKYKVPSMRSGFTLIEWGGTNIDLNNLKP